MAGYVLYNHLAGGGKNEQSVRKQAGMWKEELHFLELNEQTDYPGLLEGLQPEDYIILAGGDGTLNRLLQSLFETSV